MFLLLAYSMDISHLHVIADVTGKLSTAVGNLYILGNESRSLGAIAHTGRRKR